MTPQFCDISQFQPQQINWQAYKAWAASGDGISRIAIRSTYGVGYKDQHFDAYRAGALSAGIDVLILYHYAYPQYNNPVDEANWQKQAVGSIRSQDMLILDFEENVIQATAYWAHIWLQAQEANYSKLPGLYASSAYIQQRLQDQRLARYPLWLANWQFTPDERPPVPYPWSSYEFVQYTDRATNVPGIPGTVDANIFLGERQLQQQEEEQLIMIDLKTPGVSSYFEATNDPAVWKCKKNGYLVGHGILSFYQKFGGNRLCGLTHLGLPLTNEIGAGKSGTAYQRFERGVVMYDVNRVIDAPPGASEPAYLAHVDSGPGQDPRIGGLAEQVDHLTAENVALQDQLDSGKIITQDLLDDINDVATNAEALLEKSQKLQKDAGI